MKPLLRVTKPQSPALLRGTRTVLSFSLLDSYAALPLTVHQFVGRLRPKKRAAKADVIGVVDRMARNARIQNPCKPLFQANKRLDAGWGI